MMGLETIVALNNEVARSAATKKLIPYRADGPEEAYELSTFPFPNLGSYCPDGWEKVESWFVDRTGEGYESEPALTQRTFSQLR